MGYVGKDPKKCITCEQYKARSEFSKHGKAAGGVQSSCKLCSCKLSKERRDADPFTQAKILRRARLKKTYGMSELDYDTMLAAQSMGCAICGSPDPGGRVGRCGPVFHVDHCHKSGQIRGLLCHYCNIGLGHFGDDILTLARAITYVERSR